MKQGKVLHRISHSNVKSYSTASYLVSGTYATAIIYHHSKPVEYCQGNLRQIPFENYNDIITNLHEKGNPTEDFY